MLSSEEEMQLLTFLGGGQKNKTQLLASSAGDVASVA